MLKTNPYTKYQVKFILRISLQRKVDYAVLFQCGRGRGPGIWKGNKTDGVPAQLTKSVSPAKAKTPSAILKSSSIIK